MENKGRIYILTNPSFPEYVKLGYTTKSVESRVKELNRSECIPFAFRIYATYEVPSLLSDLQFHKIIDQLNPGLRSIDTIDGKTRKREFYAMDKEDAYGLLEAIATMHNAIDKLVLVKPTSEESLEEKTAMDIEIEATERKESFSFFKCGITVGETIEYIHDPSIKCIVIDARNLEYGGEKISMSKLARKLLNRNSQVQGTLHFSYKGEPVNDLRARLELEDKYN